MESLISIIIPVYNAAPYLKEALDSVIGQTYENLEIIVVDDGSTDDSGSICDEYRTDPRVIVIHQQHQGVSSARNAGLDRMTGEYVAFLDSDDAYDQSFMHTMLEVTLSENVDIVACKYYMLHNVKGRSLKALSTARHGIFPIPKPGVYNRKDALQALGNWMINIEVWNKLYKSELWKNNRFPTEYDVAEEVVSYEVFDLCSSVCVIDQALYFHRRRSESLSSSYTEKCVQDRILHHSYMEQFIVAHTPEIFSEDRLLQCKQARLQTIICQFAYVKERALSNKLKDQSIILAEQIGMGNCRFEQRAGCFMIRFCPWLFRALYPIYYPIRIWIRRIRG